MFARKLISTPRFAARAFGVVAPEAGTAGGIPVKVYNSEGTKRVLVTKPLPGERWLELLSEFRVEVCDLNAPEDTILTNDKIAALIGDKCDGVIGQVNFQTMVS